MGVDADIRKAVAWGKRVQIGHEQSWDGFCQSTGAAVTITTAPQHGTLDQVREPSTVRSKGSCRGAHITALDIYYTPQRGYEGLDTVSFTPVFVMARIAGWTAHVAEQAADNALIRPLAHYAGEPERALSGRELVAG